MQGAVNGTLSGLAARILPMPDWLTVREAALYLKVDRTTIYRYCDLGLLPFFELKTGRGRRFKREDLDALLEQGAPREGKHDGERTAR
jgi:excisionase family DNA binding protein